ncbi:caspase family protein [Mesorhizobium sp. AR07]|uniref:caspase family protein n=1 Tax=Mesorhizobium sp. AR07 TaxID=2865838 RepID=UPI00215F845E|nr:caspase family protein [Mesorhizobium sp. AR07]UVK45148.1 caspase family protein [Mesorhizobium sp. AR07]
MNWASRGAIAAACGAWIKVMRLFLAAVLLMTMTFFSAARGEERIALVVANPTYEGAPAIANAGLSAELVAACLRSLGFTVRQMSDGDRADVARAMYDFAKSLANPDAVGIFYYVGHTAQADNRNYLLTRGARTGSREAVDQTALPLDLFMQALEATPTLKVVLLDDPGDANNPTPGVMQGLTAVGPPSSAIVAFSAKPGSVALNENRPATVFADALTAALTRRGVDIGTILASVTQTVAEKTLGAQWPWVAHGLSADSHFVPTPREPVAAAPAPPAPIEAPPEPASPEPAPPPVQSGADGGGYGSPQGSYDSGSDASGPAGGAYGSGSFDGSSQEQPPMDVAPGSGNPDASTGNGADETAQYEEYKRQELQRQQYEEQARRQYEEQRKYQEDAAKAAAAAQSNLGETYQSDGGAAGTEPTPPADAPPAMEPPAPPPDTAASQEPATALPPAPAPVPAPPPVIAPTTADAPSTPPLDAPPPALSPPVGNNPVEIVRHPTIDAPDEIVAGETVTVSIALTEEQLTPEVTVKAAPGSTVTADGALAMAMPAGTDTWPIDIDLFASGFDLADGGKWSRKTTLYRQGDSDFVRFDLKARPIAKDSKSAQFIARIYSAGRFLGSASRPVIVRRTASVEAGTEGTAASRAAAPAMLTLASAPPQPALTGSVQLGNASPDDVPDLDVTILYDDPSGLGPGQIIIHSPHLAGPVTDTFSTPPQMAAWLDSEYRRLLQLGLSLRGAVSLQQPAESSDPGAQKRFVTLAAEGFGDALYRDYVPEAFKDVFWSLRDKGELHSIQITSNSPTLPWELIRPQSADGATRDDFLGMSYRLARWAPRSTSSQVDNPLDRMAFTGVAAVAPSYVDKQSLPFQEVEIGALSKLAGYRRFDGDFVSFEKLVGEVSTGFIHFSGHGEVNQPSSGRPVFAIDLVDQSLDPDTWRALVSAAHGKGNPFYFFNACDTGKSRILGGFVQGWGPAVLAGGASGFIGGMWPLTDRAAAAFSSDFYSGISARLKDGPVYLAEMLQVVRKRFYETGDPTYLAYTFYGNANLQVVTQ